MKESIEQSQPYPELESLERKVVENEEDRDLLPETLEFMRNHINLSEFDPKWEFRQIKIFVKTLPLDTQSSQRRKLIQEFKAKLKLRREGMAEMQIQMEQLFRDNPDISETEALARVRKLIDEHSISWLSENEHLRAVEKYLKIRDKVRALITRYKMLHEDHWEVELFKDLFGRYPNGKIEIETTLAGVYIRIHDIEDFVTAHTGNEKDESTLKTARMSGGAHLGRTFSQIPDLSGKVTIENSSMTWNEINSNRVKAHEEEHAIHRNLYPEWLFGSPSDPYHWDLRINETIDESKLVREMTNFIKKGFIALQGKAKTEILAYLKDGTFNLAYIRSLLKKKGGLYDYLESQITHIRETVVKNFLLKNGVKVSRNGVILSDEEVVEVAVDLLKKLYEKEYLKTLELAFDSVLDLTNRYSKDPQNRAKVINLLSQEPIEKWPRLAKILS